MEVCLDPLNLGLLSWSLAFVTAIATTALWDFTVKIIAKRIATPSCRIVERIPLSLGDCACLVCGQVLQVAFVSHVLATLHEAQIIATWSNVTIAPLTLILLDDFVYYWVHRALHRWPMLYYYIHSRHHTRVQPCRGHLDAVILNPLEQIIVESIFIVCLKLIAPYSHMLTLIGCFIVYAFCGVVNHTALDVRILGYSARAHELHHIHRKCNYAQRHMLYDRLFGTFMDSQTYRASEKS